MELSQLRYFVAAAQREHITQAAETLHITQPALSRVISRLEDDLGVPLFEHEGKNIHLNEYGKVVLRYAESLLQGVEDMRMELSELSSGLTGDVRVGSSFPAGEPNWVLEQVREFTLHRPDISFHLQQYTANELWLALKSRDIDLAISTTPISSSGFVWTPLFVEKMGIIMSRQHPLASKPNLSLRDFMGERFYCNNANSDVRDLTYQFCERAGFYPNIHFECEFASYIGEAVSLGYGISMISERGQRQSQAKMMKQPWENNIVFRTVREEYCKRECGIAFLEQQYLPRAANAFLQNMLRSFPTNR